MSIRVAGAAPANRGMLGFGHAIFTIFHVTALYSSAPYLLITIPLHLIYTAAASATQDRAPRARMHVADVAPSKPSSTRDDPETSWGRRMKVRIFSWLPIEWLL